MKPKPTSQADEGEQKRQPYAVVAASFSKKLDSLLGEYTGLLDSVTMAQAAAAALNQRIANRRDPESALARALNRGTARREQLKHEEGGSLSAEEAAQKLGMSKTAVIDRYRKHRLLGWRESRQNAIRFPAWQFSEDGTTLAGLEAVLTVLNRPDSLDDWGRIGFFLGPRERHNGKRPLDLLREGRVEEVRQMAAADVE